MYFWDNMGHDWDFKINLYLSCLKSIEEFLLVACWNLSKTYPYKIEKNLLVYVYWAVSSNLEELFLLIFFKYLPVQDLHLPPPPESENFDFWCVFLFVHDPY